MRDMQHIWGPIQASFYSYAFDLLSSSFTIRNIMILKIFMVFIYIAVGVKVLNVTGGDIIWGETNEEVQIEVSEDSLKWN